MRYHEPKPIWTHNRRPDLDIEENNGPVIVERSGYMNTKDKVIGMFLAGQRLADIRAAKFDFQSEAQDDGSLDPTRSGDYDLSDAARDLRTVSDRLATQKAASETKETTSDSNPSNGEKNSSETAEEPIDTDA
jgi:hypothetical protein